MKLGVYLAGEQQQHLAEHRVAVAVAAAAAAAALSTRCSATSSPSFAAITQGQGAPGLASEVSARLPPL